MTVLDRLSGNATVFKWCTTFRKTEYFGTLPERLPQISQYLPSDIDLLGQFGHLVRSVGEARRHPFSCVVGRFSRL